jgi:hypothetical protein
VSPATNYLLPLACCLLLLTAGCSALVGSPEPKFEPVAVDVFEVSNKDEEPHRVHVAVVENGTVVYVSSFRVNGTYRGEKGTVAPSTVIDPNPMSEPGNYTVVGRVDDGRIDSVPLGELSPRFGCDPDQQTVVSLDARDDGGLSMGVGCDDG